MLPTNPSTEMKTPARAKIWHSVAVRLADEGVPVRAIVRALMLPYAEVRGVLGDASERGMILDVPRDDWPPGTRRDERQPDTVPLAFEDDHMIMLSIRTFHFTPTEAKLFVTLLRRREVAKGSLHVMSQRDEGHSYPDPGKEPSQLKIIDVYICKMRKKLPTEIDIITMWGKGYYIPPAAKEAAFKRLGIKHDTFIVPPPQSKEAANELEQSGPVER